MLQVKQGCGQCLSLIHIFRVPLFLNGECVYQSPSIDDIKKYCEEQMKTLWDEMLRFENPQTYYVDLSQALWDMKEELLNKATYKKK